MQAPPPTIQQLHQEQRRRKQRKNARLLTATFFVAVGSISYIIYKEREKRNEPDDEDKPTQTAPDETLTSGPNTRTMWFIVNCVLASILGYFTTPEGFDGYFYLWVALLVSQFALVIFILTYHGTGLFFYINIIFFIFVILVGVYFADFFADARDWAKERMGVGQDLTMFDGYNKRLDTELDTEDVEREHLHRLFTGKNQAIADAMHSKFGSDKAYLEHLSDLANILKEIKPKGFKHRLEETRKANEGRFGVLRARIGFSHTLMNNFHNTIKVLEKRQHDDDANEGEIAWSLLEIKDQLVLVKGWFLQGFWPFENEEELEQKIRDGLIKRVKGGKGKVKEGGMRMMNPFNEKEDLILSDEAFQDWANKEKGYAND